MLDLTTYTPEHRQELEDLLNTPAWRKVIENGLVDRVAKKRIEPGSTRDYIGAAIDQLLSFNEHRVRRRKDIWGENGLVHFASERGAAVNINTNATRLTPEVILHLIAAGIAKLHISLDTPDKATQNTMFGGNRFDRVLEGIYNVQLARDLIGVTYPEIRTNCVLTNKNMETFPDLLSFIFTKRKQLTNRRQPLFNDLFPQT
ncbi:MAG: hypothetical protein QGG64_07270, partial [Candidatus Latescibacteria bacterium]|nr:hypothetical protein [Candidatus Latescibacterota bacterium]